MKPARNFLTTTIFLLALIMPKIIFSQNQTDTQQIIADIIEDLTSKAESDELDYSQLTDKLLELSGNPINLNTTTFDDLKSLIFLSDFQIASLLDYRDSTGTILSIYELQTVPGFDTIDIQRLQPFVKFDIEEKPQPESMLWGRNELVMRFKTSIETPVGYTNNYSETSRYLGNKNSYYTRYTYHGGKYLKMGFTAEKDAGEPFFDGTFNGGFDYISGYISLSKYGKIKKLIVGDFHAEFGQGLTFWNSLSFGKSGSVLSVRKRADGIVKHSSAYESQYLRGVGIIIPVGKMDFTLFGSYKRIDANISDTLDNGELAFTSLPETGYHRTFTEIENRNNVGELVFGTNTTYNTKRLKIGATFAHSKINGRLDQNLSIYQLAPTPTEKNAIGLNFDANIGKHQIFGEIATTLPDGNLTTVAGGLFRLSNTVQMSILGRSYSRNFNPRYTAGFAEGSGTYNENGLYTGISILPTKGWRLSGYIDLFQFPWLKYMVNAPSNGKEFLLFSEHSINNDFSLILRIRYKQTEKNQSNANTPIVPIVQQNYQNYRILINYNATSSVSLKTCLEISGFDTDSSKSELGYLITQDFGYNAYKLPITINFRFAIFDTPSWNSRIYSYENDMLYSFSIPAYYSKGTRMFVLVKYSPARWIDLWIRYAQTYYSELNELGQGADLINGNTHNEIKAMIRLKF